MLEPPLHAGHLTHMVDAFPYVLFPLTGWIPFVSVCFRGYRLVIWGILPLCWGFGGINTSIKLGVLQYIHWVSIMLYLVVHFVSSIYHGYDYYSASYGGVFWSVIYFISDHGPFLDRASCNMGQHEVVLPPPLMLRCPGGVIGLASVPQQQPQPLNPLLAYANYAMGSPQVGFLFRAEPSTILYIMFGVHSGVCFLFSGAKLHAVFPYGGSTIRVCTIATLWSLPMAGICVTW